MSSTRGRPPVLDEAKRRDIVAIVSVGCTRRTAALYVGCHVDTIRKTARREPGFATALSQAETRHEILHLKNVNNAAAEARYWRAAAWALERCYPDRYGQRRAGTITAEQLSQVVSEFATIVAAEVPQVRARKRILKKLRSLADRVYESSSKAPAK